MARVYVGKACVFKSDKHGEVADYLRSAGAAERVKCCGLVFRAQRGDDVWAAFTEHLQDQHSSAIDDDPTPEVERIVTINPTKKTWTTRKPAARKGKP